jgi:hypothetical protein
MTYGSVFDSKSGEITTLVHFSAACLAMPEVSKSSRWGG